MTPEQAHQFLTQIAQDFINTLPMSARQATAQAAQAALDALKPKSQP